MNVNLVIEIATLALAIARTARLTEISKAIRFTKRVCWRSSRKPFRLTGTTPASPWIHP